MMAFLEGALEETLRSLYFSFFFCRNNIALFDLPACQNAGKYPLMRHDAGAHALPDGACLVTFLSNLSHLQHHVSMCL